MFSTLSLKREDESEREWSKMKKVLYISDAVPYDKIRHAGGKTLNYYISHALKSKDFEITLVGLCKEEERKDFDKEKLGLRCYPVVTRGTFWINVKRILTDIVGKVFYQHNNAEISFYALTEIERVIKSLKKSGYEPDVVLLEWTKMVLQVDRIRSIFPTAKYIASEHDVAFLGLERKVLNTPANKKADVQRVYERGKVKELHCLDVCDVVMPQCNKDKNLLIQNGVDENKIYVLTPYFHDMRRIERTNVNHDILFWGAMYRADNYNAAIWFIEKVMPLLEDTDVRFIVAGNRPPERLKKYANDRIKVTGFVQNEVPLFETALCTVVPLLGGAGIKVKVIESLSAGVPVLTNDIGIEGIDAVDGISYFHCTKPEDYAKVIKQLLEGEINTERLKENQYSFIRENFDLAQAAEKYCEMIQKL